MGQRSVYPIPSCAECNLASAGCCPACRRHLCPDHFARDEHRPCAARLLAHADDYICYVCGAEALPAQWSTSEFAHYIDYGRCNGCKRSICDELHTRVREEQIEIVRDGMRSQRYYVTQRYCDSCAPLRTFGGIMGACRWLLALSGVVVTGTIVIVQFFR